MLHNFINVLVSPVFFRILYQASYGWGADFPTKRGLCPLIWKLYYYASLANIKRFGTDRSHGGRYEGETHIPATALVC